MGRLGDFLAMIGGAILVAAIGWAGFQWWGWPWYAPTLGVYVGAILGTVIRIVLLA